MLRDCAQNFSRGLIRVRVALQIRFTRLGRKKLPFYRIVAVDSRKRRDGRPLEVNFQATASVAALLFFWSCDKCKFLAKRTIII